MARGMLLLVFSSALVILMLTPLEPIDFLFFLPIIFFAG
jgi:hypothetical protein